MSVGDWVMRMEGLPGAGRLVKAVRQRLRLARVGRLTRGEPVFIVGCGRSGTTMLLAILSADPTLYCVSEETESFADVGDYTPAEGDRRRRLLHACIAAETTPFGARRRYVEKTPKHVHSIAFIRRAYSGRVKFIHIVRDGRDVVTSKHPTTNKETFHIHVDRWVRDVSAGLAFQADPDMFTVRYEDIIQDFEPTMGRLYAFLGQTMPPEAQAFERKATVRRHWAWPDEVRSLSAASIGRWKLPELEARVALLQADAGAMALLERLGYPH